MSGLNSDIIAAGETLFDFLKRKKMHNLENTLNKSIASYRSTIVEPLRSQTIHNHTPTKAHTPHKTASFAQERSGHKSVQFAQLLSPNHIVKDEKQMGQPYNRQQIRKKINGLKEVVLQVLEMGQKAKNKVNALAVQIYSVCLSCQHQLLPNIKQGTKMVEKMLSSFDSQETIQTFNKLQKMISEYIDTLLHKQKHQPFPKPQPSQQMLYANHKLQKQIDILKRKLQKAQLQQEDEKEKYQKEQMKESQVCERLRLRHAEEKEEIIKQLEQIKRQNKELVLKATQLQKYIKNETYLQQEREKKQRDLALEADRSRQDYFRKQIDALRKQCGSDVNRMEVLSRVKEQEYQIREKELKEQIAGREFQWDVERERREKAEKQMKIFQQECFIIREKDKQLLKDMEHMNYELYHHWLALKDIKTLTNRINTFAPIRRIYADLAFNDALFP